MTNIDHDLIAYLREIAEYPHALDYEQVVRPVKGQKRKEKIGLGAKRPVEKEPLDVEAILAKNTEYIPAWEAGLFHISPFKPYGKSREKNILSGTGLPDSHEQPYAPLARADEEFLQNGVIKLTHDCSGLKSEFDDDITWEDDTPKRKNAKVRYSDIREKVRVAAIARQR